MRTRRTFTLSLASAIALGASGIVFSQQAAAWEPKKPVEFVIMAGQGGGADKMARLMQSIIEKHKFSPKPFVPVNKPGGSGAEALVHLNSAKGIAKDHTVMVTLNSFYTTPLRQPNLKIDIMTFSPVARMAEDTFLLWVHKDSGITDIDGYVKAAKAAGNDWVMAGTGKAQEDQLLTDFLNRTYGLSMKYVPFKGGGAVAKQLAGKHVNSTVNNPSEALGFYEAGTVNAIASFTAKRLAKFPDTPTFEEMGKDFSYFMQRSVVGAPGMSDEAAAFYREVFEKVYISEEWQKYMADKSLKGEFLTGDKLKEYWSTQRVVHEVMLREIGEI